MWNVIIVDDDILVQKGLKSLISWEHYNLRIRAVLSNGQEAYHYIMHNDVDAVITDIKMPKMSGVELIKKVRKTDNRIEFLILSGYDDYQYLKEAIRFRVISYMLKPINLDEFKSNIQTLSTTLKNRQANQMVLEEGKTSMTNTLFCRLIKGAISHLEFENKLEFLGLESAFHWSSYTLVWVYSPDAGRLDGTKKEQFQRELLSVAVNDKNRDYLFFLDSYNNFYLISENPSQLASSFHAKISILKLQFTVRINMIGGMKVSSMYELGLSYQSIQEYRMRLPQDEEFFTMEYCPYPTLVEKATKSKNQLPFIKDLYAAVHDLDLKLVRTLLMQTLKEDGDFNTVCQTIFSLEIYIIGVLQNKYSELVNIASELNLTPFKFTGFSKIADLEEEITNFTTSLADILYEEDYASDIPPLVKDMIRYVKLNYSSPISLKQFAYQVDMNPIYLGSLFFEIMGVKFTTYATQHRLQKSCHLLRTTNFTISRIASIVGFSSVKYFFRIFRENLKVTPTEYRNNHA